MGNHESGSCLLHTQPRDAIAFVSNQPVDARRARDADLPILHRQSAAVTITSSSSIVPQTRGDEVCSCLKQQPLSSLQTARKMTFGIRIFHRTTRMVQDANSCNINTTIILYTIHAPPLCGTVRFAVADDDARFPLDVSDTFTSVYTRSSPPVRAATEPVVMITVAKRPIQSVSTHQSKHSPC